VTRRRRSTLLKPQRRVIINPPRNDKEIEKDAPVTDRLEDMYVMEEEVVGASLTLEDWLGSCHRLVGVKCATKIRNGIHIVNHPTITSALYWMSLQEDWKFQRLVLQGEWHTRDRRQVLENKQNELLSLRQQRNESSTLTIRVCRRQTVPILALLMAEGRLDEDLSDEEFEQLVEQLSQGPVYEEREEKQLAVDYGTVDEECKLEVEIKQLSFELSGFPRYISLTKTSVFDEAKSSRRLELPDLTENLSEFDERVLSAAEINENQNADTLDSSIPSDDEEEDDAFNEGDLWILMETNACRSSFIGYQRRGNRTWSQGIRDNTQLQPSNVPSFFQRR